MPNTTNYADFVVDVRCLIGDTDPDGIYLVATDQIQAALATVTRLGKVPGWTCIADRSAITPTLDPAQGPGQLKAFAQLIYNASKLFTTAMTDYHIATRAFKRSSRRPQDLIDDILTEISNLENGTESAQTGISSYAEPPINYGNPFR